MTFHLKLLRLIGFKHSNFARFFSRKNLDRNKLLPYSHWRKLKNFRFFGNSSGKCAKRRPPRNECGNIWRILSSNCQSFLICEIEYYAAGSMNCFFHSLIGTLKLSDYAFETFRACACRVWHIESDKLISSWKPFKRRALRARFSHRHVIHYNWRSKAETLIMLNREHISSKLIAFIMWGISSTASMNCLSAHFH